MAGELEWCFADNDERKACRGVVRGFSLAVHDPEGSHYKIWRRKLCPKLLARM
jgi:hypothetical protein